MSVFKRRRFPAQIILLCVRWCCRYSISYRDPEEMMAERGVAVDTQRVYRWTQRYAPELEKRVLWYQSYRSSSWRDEASRHVTGRNAIHPCFHQVTGSAALAAPTERGQTHKR